MAEATTILENLQEDIVAVLREVEGLQDAYIFTGSEKDLKTKLERTFATRKNSANGKRGLGIHVLPLEAGVEDENLPGPLLEVRAEIVCIEALQINQGANGTGVSSSAAALRTLKALHHRLFDDKALYPDKRAIRPFPVDDGLEGRVVTMIMRNVGDEVQEKVAPVDASIDQNPPHALTLTTATPDAQIYYTTDGSYPSKDKTLYEDPIEGLEIGTSLRTAAYKDGLLPSNSTKIILTE